MTVRLVGGGSEYVKVHSGMVHVRWLRSELLLVIQAIHLSRLCVCTVSLLLNLVRSLSVPLLVVFFSECDS